MLTIALVIPALNEEASLGPVLNAIPRPLVGRVIVVDNGSSDTTPQVALKGGAEVIYENRRGYGYACYAGAMAAADCDILVFMDADGADDPREIPLLLAPFLAASPVDMVLGSRTRGQHEAGALLPHARFGNWLTARLMHWFYGLEVSDLGPFRAIRRDVFLALGMQEFTYGWTTEMMVKAARGGYQIKEVPVSYYRRKGGKSKISGTLKGTILAGYYILTTTFKHRN
jgi:glycosyltransferase involved in cell wall biosynthesis